MSVERVAVEADGGSRGNPGNAGYGAAVLDADGTVLATRRGALGVSTNNVAEYRGLIAGLTAAAELGARFVDVRMDSKLIVEQMCGRWKVKNATLQPLAAHARKLAAHFDTVTFDWIPRARNKIADGLANEAMDGYAAGQLQPEELTEPETLPVSPDTAQPDTAQPDTAQPGAVPTSPDAHSADTLSSPDVAQSGKVSISSVGSQSGGVPTSRGRPSGTAQTGELPVSSEAAQPDAASASLAGQAGEAATWASISQTENVPASAEAPSDAKQPGDVPVSPAVKTGADPAQSGAKTGQSPTSADTVKTGKVPVSRRSARQSSAAAEQPASLFDLPDSDPPDSDPPGSAVPGEPGAAAHVSTAPAAVWSGAMGKPLRLILLRHGQTELSVRRKYSGRGNPPLTEVGMRQAAAAADRLGAGSDRGPGRGVAKDIAAIITSPLLRARQTAEAVAASTGVGVDTAAALIEVDFGSWEGLSFAEAAERDPELHRSWLADPSVPAPGGESFDQVYARVSGFKDELLQRFAGRTVILVSHVTPIKTLLRIGLDAGPSVLYRIHLDLASISTVDFYPDGNSSVSLVNDTAQLPRA